MDNLKMKQPRQNASVPFPGIESGTRWGLVNTTYANLYREATFHCEVDSQLVLGERVIILGEENDFLRVRSEDGYQGWVNRHQIIDENEDRRKPRTMVTALLSELHEQPDASSPARGWVVAGNYLFVGETQKEWLRVTLPDGIQAWVSISALSPMPQVSRKGLIAYANRMMGTSYIWGGKTPLGLDCSGFIQLVHKVFNISLRRDARMQFEDARHVSDDPMQGQAGDLMFFAEIGENITHVGFCLGDGRVLHARGKVHINSLKKGSKEYDPGLLRNFVAVRTFMKEEK